MSDSPCLLEGNSHRSDLTCSSERMDGHSLDAGDSLKLSKSSCDKIHQTTYNYLQKSSVNICVCLYIFTNFAVHGNLSLPSFYYNKRKHRKVVRLRKIILRHLALITLRH